MKRAPRVKPGIDVLCTDRAASVRGRRAALLAHPASIALDLTHAIDRLRSVGVDVVRVLAPEHGTGGGHQDMAGVDEPFDPLLGAPVVSLYGHDEASLSLRPEALRGVDLVIADLMDVGARYYTFYATIVRALPACSAAGVPMIICDRPNPLGATIEGNLIEPGFESFVGELSVPQRHGLTIGELVRLAALRRRVDVELEVIAVEGWRRGWWWDETGLSWVAPSPNMPSLDTAIVYPGGCLFEATNLSEGRGTTRPFELIGAPWLDARALAATLERDQLPGAAFRAVRFIPTFQKHAGVECHGVFLHVTDREVFRPLLTGLAVLIAARNQDPERFGWRTEPYEFREDPPAIDLLAGTDAWRQGIEQGRLARELESAWLPCGTRFRDEVSEIVLYPD